MPRPAPEHTLRTFLLHFTSFSCMSPVCIKSILTVDDISQRFTSCSDDERRWETACDSAWPKQTNQKKKKGKDVDTKLTSVKLGSSCRISTCHVFDIVLWFQPKKKFQFQILNFNFLNSILKKSDKKLIIKFCVQVAVEASYLATSADPKWEKRLNRPRPQTTADLKSEQEIYTHEIWCL